MKYIAIYGLILAVVMISGCPSNIFSTRPPERPRRGETTNVETVKQPLYKKPDFKAEKTEPGINPVDARLELARTYIDENQYTKIPPILEEINQLEPTNREASELANQVYYRIGLDFYKNRDYVASRDALSRVAPDYKNAKSLMASVGLIIDQLADAHYKKGVKYFINEELESAIRQWEKVLSLKPGHQKAAEDIENARQLLNKIKKINQQPKP